MSKDRRPGRRVFRCDCGKLNCFKYGLPACAVKNGRRRVRGCLAQQYRCMKCHRQWTEAAHARFVLSDFTGRVLVVKVLKGLGLFAIGLPMDRVEQLLGLKGETLRKHLLWLSREEVWDHVKELIVCKLRISESELEEIRLLPIELDYVPQPFRCRAHEFRRLRALERRNILRRAVRIAESKIAI
jgi:hypothetical protein